MTNDEVLQAAKEATNNQPIYGRKEFTFSAEELQRFAAIIEKRTIERCVVALMEQRDELLAALERAETAMEICSDWMSKSDVPFRAAEMLRALSGSEQLQAKNAELTAEVERLKEENDTLRRIHKESIDILVKELSDKDYEYNQKTNRLIERHAEQLNRCDAEVKRLTGRKDGEVPNY